MLKRKIKKVAGNLLRKLTGRKLLICHVCNVEEIEVSSDTARVTCGRCTLNMVEPPPMPKKEKSDKPKGWHFKVYFEHDGKVYTKGVEVTDPDEIAKLKADNGIVTPEPKKKKATPKKKKVAKKKVVKKKQPPKKKGA